MQRLGATAIARAHVGAGVDQVANDPVPVHGRSDMQGGIALVDVVADLFEPVRLRIAARCTLGKAGAGQIRGSAKQSRNTCGIAGKDRLR